MPIFISKKVWKFLMKIQLTKSNPKRTRGGKDLSRKRPQWKKTAVEKVYGDKDYSI
jgi:hypothetical protein